MENQVIKRDIKTIEWKYVNNSFGQPLRKCFLVDDADVGMYVHINEYFAGTMTPFHTHPCSHYLYVMKGVLKTDKGSFKAGSFIRFPEGCVCEHGSTNDESVMVLFITDSPFKISYAQEDIEADRKLGISMEPVDISDIPWEKSENTLAGEIFFKPLARSPKTGTSVKQVWLMPGGTAEIAKAPYAFGFFVLDGTLRTEGEELKKGQFIWFPEGSSVRYEAAGDEALCIMVTNKS